MPPSHPSGPDDEDPIDHTLKGLQHPRGAGWVFCPLGPGEDAQLTWHMVELGIGLLQINKLDKAIYYFSAASQRGYPGANLIHAACVNLRDALFQSEVDHLTGDEPEPGAGLRQAREAVSESLLQAAQAIADVIIGDARAEAQAIVDKAPAQAPHRRHRQTRPGSL